MKKSILGMLMGLLVAASFTACNTVHGIGADMSAGGQAVERVASSAHH